MTSFRASRSARRMVAAFFRPMRGAPTWKASPAPTSARAGRTDRIKKKPSEYLKQLSFAEMVFTPEGLRHLAAEAGASHLVLDTDLPFP